MIRYTRTGLQGYKIAITSLAFAAVMATTCHAATVDNRCTSKTAEIGSSIDHIDSWKALQASFHTDGVCDNGAIAEAFDDAVSKVMLRQWSHISSVTQSLNTDKNFRIFILRHINEMWSAEDLDAVKHLARTQCPAKLTGFCAEVVTAADAAKK